MRKLLSKFIGYVTESTARTAVGISVLGLILSVGFVAAHAATTYNVMNVPDMTLARRTTTTGTTGNFAITVNWPRRNGVQVAYPTLSGGVLELNDGTNVEHVYYSRATSNSTAKTFTLTGTVIRNLDWNDCTAYVSDGDGKIFQPGTKVRLVNDCRLYNLSFHTDRVSQLTGSAALTSTQTTQPFLFPNSVTTAQRDAFTYGNDKNGIIYNSTVGALQVRAGGTWLSLAVSTGSFINASESAAGKIQLATLANQIALTNTGSTGAPLMAQIKNMTFTGAVSNYGKIPLVGPLGTIPSSLIPASPSDAIVYGDQSDGNKTLSGTLTLTRDMYYATLTLNGQTINTAGYKVFAYVITGSGKIKAPTGGAGGAGGNAVADAAGAAGTAGARVATGSLISAMPGRPGVAGGAGRTSNGVGTDAAASPNGIGTTNSLSTTNGTGGSIGGAGGAAGANAGGASTQGLKSTTSGAVRYPLATYINMTSNIGNRWLDITGISASAGSGGGGGGARNCTGGAEPSGGGGGSGGSGASGGMFFVSAKTWTGTFTVESIGGAGGAGGNGAAAAACGGGGAGNGGGGGGAGGQGGPGGSGVAIRQIYTNWSGSFVLTGGAAGAAGTAGAGASGGSAGVTPGASDSGPAGTALVISLQ